MRQQAALVSLVENAFKKFDVSINELIILKCGIMVIIQLG